MGSDLLREFFLDFWMDVFAIEDMIRYFFKQKGLVIYFVHSKAQLRAVFCMYCIRS